MSNPGGLNGLSREHRPLRVLEYLGNAIVGGMESYARTLIAGLSAGDFEVTCICPFESPFTATLRTLGCKVYVAPIQDDPLWRSIEMGVQVVRQHGIDVIHANLPNAHTNAGVVGRLTDTPAVATIHSRALWIQELSVARVTGTHLITVCQEAYAQALSTGLPADQVSLISNGVDVGRFRPDHGRGFRQEFDIPPDAQLVGFVGRLSWEKGPDRFLQAAERILRELPDVHFMMVGEGPAEPDLRTMVDDMGIDHRVHFAGLRLDVERCYPALDLFVQTSRTEAMPLAMIEAMASGLPTVAIAVGGVTELVETDTTGLLVNAGEWRGVSNQYPSDWEGIACAALDLLRNPERLRAMGAAARLRAERQFNLATTVRETGNLFRRLARPAQTENWAALSSVVNGKGDGERRVRLKAAAGAIDGGARNGFAAVRSAETS